MKNHYQVLEVEPDASDEKIKEQYLFLAQAWHPDKFSKAEQKALAEEKIKQINAAYDVLRSPAKRAEYDQKLQSSKKKKAKEPPPTQARPQPAAHPQVKVPPIKKAPTRSRGLFPIIGSSSRDLRQSPQESIKVFINGRAVLLSGDELVHARVQYFLNGESKGILEFTSRQHVQAAVRQVALPNGYEIHVLRLAPYEGRPEQIFTPKVRTAPRR
jgi:curved DNA-binding protein CbpA